MRILKVNFQKVFLSGFLIFFILIYFYFLMNSNAIPSNYNIPFISLIGFSIIIIAIFYFFLVFLKDENSHLRKFKFIFLNENLIKSILLGVMCLTLIIPPITFSEIIIDWNAISFLNLVRGLAFLLGIAYIPGSCFYNLFLSNSDLPQKFGIEPFLLKITIYPLISFNFLGVITLILEKLGLKREFFSFFLFIFILILYIIDIWLNSFRNSKHRKIEFKITRYHISKATLLILIISFSIIIIASGIFISAPYMFGSDPQRGINYANYVGIPNAPVFIGYSKFWGYVSYSIACLSGIPVINITALLFIFLYLFGTSTYLFMKAILYRFKEIYVILSSIFVIIFSNLFYFFNVDYELYSASALIVQGMFVCSFKSFSIFLFEISISLFIIEIKSLNHSNYKLTFRNRNFLIIILAVWLLFQSFIIYYLPALFGFLFIIIFSLTEKSEDKKIIFKLTIAFVSIFILFYVIFDIISLFYLSKISLRLIYYFFNVNLDFTTADYFNAIIFYTISVACVLTLIVFNSFYLRLKKYIKRKRIMKSVDFKFIIISILIPFSGLFCLEIILNIIYTIRNLYFFTYYTHLFFESIGFFGLIGLYFSLKVCNFENKLFSTLILWFISSFFLASIFIYFNWFRYPSRSPIEIPYNLFVNMEYWYSRTWYYSIFPLSILAAIGIIETLKVKKRKQFFFLKNKYVKNLIQSCSIAMLIIFATSNTIISNVYWYNHYWKVSDQDAQIIGWISENTPLNSNILTDNVFLQNFIKDISLRNTSLISEEFESALADYDLMNVNNTIDQNCSIDLLNEYDNYKKVIKFNDQNQTGSALSLIEFVNVHYFGWVKFNLKTENSSKLFKIILKSSFLDNEIMVSIRENSLSYFNGTSYNKLVNISDNSWYDISIYFKCTDFGNFNLSANQWSIFINNTQYGVFPILRNYEDIKYLELSTSDSDFNWNIFLSNFTIFKENSDIEFSICKDYVIFNWLAQKNILYFVLSNEYNYIKEEVEKIINITMSLLPKFFNSTLYQYKDLTIYKSRFNLIS